jgi:predicted MFS family arabinose efflux permease
VAEGQVGTGFAFGLQEALDQLGAFLGPLVFTAVFFITGREGLGEYRLGYGLMTVPFVILMLAVFLARRGVRRSGLMEPREAGTKGSDRLSGVFWIYTLFTLLSTLGFAQFALIGYHLKARALFSDGEITLLYSVTMAVDAAAALVIGRIYDRVKLKRGDKRAGLLTLLFVPFATAAIPLLALGSTAAVVIAGLVCYGAVMGAHETIMRSAIADITPLAKRGTGYGIFNAAYGLSLFLGSYLFGALYDQLGVGAIRLVVLVTQALAVGVFFVMKKRIGKGHSA